MRAGLQAKVSESGLYRRAEPGKDESREELIHRYADHNFAGDFQYFYDICVVRPPEASASSVDCRDPGQLADRPGRILLSGAGQPDRLWRIHRLPIEDHPG